VRHERAEQDVLERQLFDRKWLHCAVAGRRRPIIGERAGGSPVRVVRSRAVPRLGRLVVRARA
jgi:hypothetical protein